MRILHVIYDDVENPWLGGGGAMRTWEICRRIAAERHRVTVLCGRYPGAKRREVFAGIHYRRVGLSSSYITSRLSFSVGAARLMGRGGYDIVIEDVSPYSPVGAPLWARRGTPVVASVQNLSGEHAPGKYGPLGWLPRLVERPLLGLFDNMIAVSPGIAARLSDMYGAGRDIRVVPNAVGDEFFAAGEAPGANFSGAPYFLFLGRLDVYQKGLDALVQVFQTIAARVPEVRLLIAGAGNAGQQVKLDSLVSASPARDRIRLIGKVPPSEGARLMARALALMMPSRYEAWPLTALEAGAAGLPVLGYDIVGVRDAAPPPPRGHGLLVPEGDEEGLAELAVRVAREPALREAAGSVGRRWAARFSWDALAREQLSFYEELVAKSRPSS